MQRTLAVQGSQGDIYQIVVEIENAQAAARCSCRAGLSEQFCRHVSALLTGDGSVAAPQHIEEFQAAHEELRATDLFAAMLDLIDAEDQAAAAKAASGKARKRVARLTHRTDLAG